MRSLSALSLLVLLAATALAQVRQTYASAEVDADKNLRIVTSDGKTIIVPKSGEYEGHGK